ncbi:hypothetical protein AB0C61_16290 [Streptomyces sp. NPDC048680]|uniref:hypothetical protein n=1 Tax=Streptomyces sp. NPDC048680 TaxID=3155492 RepID=UPI003442C805
MTDAPQEVTLLLADPSHNTLVIPLERARPGIDPSEMSCFGDLNWCLSDMEKKESGTGKVLDWDTVPEPLRDALKRVTWALINIPTPDIVLKRPRTTSRPSIAAGTVDSTWDAWKHLAHWLVARKISSLHQVTADDLEEYAKHLRDLGRTWVHDRNWLFAITRMWAYSPFLQPADQLCMPPWDDPGAELTDFLGENNDPRRTENSTEVIHPATMAPLLTWSLRMVTDFAPDILAAVRERERLLGRIRSHQTGNARPQAEARHLIQHYFDNLRAARRPAPTHDDPRLRKATIARGRDARDTRPAIGSTYIAAQLGVSRPQVSTFVRDHPEALNGLHFAVGSPLDIPITALDGRPWTPQITLQESLPFAIRLSTAAMIVISYLSGMRPEEVLHLERGCSLEEAQEGGTVRFRVRGRHFKGVTDEDGNTIPEGEMRPEPWTVIELVHQAVMVAEELTDEKLLFPRSLSYAPKSSTHQGGALSADTAKGRIMSFIAWVNELAAAHGRTHEMVPPDPGGVLALGRFRRTVAWHIYRQPGGRIALGIQYGHVGASLAESYGGRTRFDMLDVLDFEEGLAMADTLAKSAERLGDGEQVSGAAAARYVAAVRDFKARYEGVFMTKNQIKSLPTNPHLRVYENPKAFLTCNYDPYKALCDPDRARNPAGHKTPSLDRCHRACGNISRTDTHIAGIRDEIKHIDEELADDALPQPLDTRLRQRSDTLHQIITEHESGRLPATRTSQEHTT